MTAQQLQPSSTPLPLWLLTPRATYSSPRLWAIASAGVPLSLSLEPLLNAIHVQVCKLSYSCFCSDGPGHNRLWCVIICRVDAVTGVITTIAGTGKAGFSGDGGAAVQAALKNPVHATFDAAGNLYISDFGNFRWGQHCQHRLSQTCSALSLLYKATSHAPGPC